MAIGEPQHRQMSWVRGFGGAEIVAITLKTRSLRSEMRRLLLGCRKP
jgi:hypothetical protein